MSSFVAVLRKNVSRPIVYGVGATPDAARADATEWADNTAELEAFPCTAELAARVGAGTIDCHIVDGVAVRAWN